MTTQVTQENYKEIAETLRQKFKADVISLMFTNYVLLENTAQMNIPNISVKGASQSFLRQHLYAKGWKGLNGNNLDKTCELAGFKVAYAKNERGRKVT